MIQNLKDFNNQWILFGLLFFSMIAFSMVFMENNNEYGLGNAQDRFNDSSNSMYGKLTSVESTGNNLLNISAENNPEISDLGSKDSVATSYGIMGSAKGYLDSFKLFMSWILYGTVGDMLIKIFVGMFSLTALYYVVKWIRAGI